ncbi:MAG: hypothetical protein ACR2MX_07770 [Cyclobacteriaceae bacterium]
MNKIKFLNFLNHPESISEADLPKLEALAEQFPYSQVIHILVAKGRHNLGLETFRLGLHKAALSANNRDLLRKLIEDVKVSNIIPPLEAEVTSPPEAASPSELLEETILSSEEATTEPVDENDETASEVNAHHEDPLEAEVVSNVETEDVKKETQDLPELDQPEKPDLEVEADANLSKPDEVGDEAPEKLEEPPIEDQETSEENGIHSELMANLERLKQQREKLDKEKEEEASGDPTSEEIDNKFDSGDDETPISDVDNQEEPIEENELVFDPPVQELTEASLTAENHPDKFEEPVESDITEQQKSQMEIIDSFIKNSPVLSKPNLSADSEATSQTDLSVKSAKFHQDFVSENLATILIKQGKRKDAVGIYKKLMVKFPKKKGYFADQIESLNTK